MVSRIVAAVLVALLVGCGGGEPPRIEGAGGDGVQVESLEIAARDDGITLHLLNKRPVGWTQPRPDRTILFLHGATFPGHAVFDLKLDGVSWMDWLARRGYDVYALDVRGYGKSTRPAEGTDLPVRTPEALRDVSKAVDVILSRTGLPRLVLVGWSWGATLAGLHAEAAGNQVERLVLLSPQWLPDGPAPDLTLEPWREVSLDQARAHWLEAVPDAERRELVPTPWLEAWTKAMEEADSAEGALRVPNGPAADALAGWKAGTPPWRPERVSVPSLVVQGEWDVDNPPAMGLAIFARLVGAPQRRYVLLGEATHSMMLEKNREQLFRLVRDFVEEKF